jgi:NNP family nitrate/nitrite transporter-like MFS transporter
LKNISTNDNTGKTHYGKSASSSNLLTILLLTVTFFLNFISRIIPSPLMPNIETELSLSHGEAGSFFLLISLGYFVALVGSGFISSQLTHRKTIILSSATVGVTLLGISLTNDLQGVRLGLFILGMAAGIYLPSGIATLTSLISPKHWGKAIAIHELAPNLGFVAAPIVSEALLLWVSWRAVFALIGLSSLLVGAVLACFIHGGEFPGESPSLKSVWMFFSERSFWIMIVLFSLGISGFLGLYTMLPLYLVSEQGIDREWANILLSLSRVSGLIMVFIGGWATDRFGSRRVIQGVFFLSGTMTVLLGLASGSWLIIIVFLQALLAVCFPPAALVALSSIGKQKAQNVAVSFTIPFAFLIGAGAVPTGIGIMADAGNFALSISLLGTLMIMGSILPGYLKFRLNEK